MTKNRLTAFLTILLSSLFFSACSLPFTSQKAGVQITSSPQAEVFLNNQSYSDTPLIKNDLKAGQYTIKIVPKDPEFLPWEGQLSLKSGIVTVVDRILSTDPNQSNGHSLSFESIKNKEISELDIITLQSNTAISIDGNPAGFTPLTGNSINPGPHVFTLTAPGYQDKIIKASVVTGYKLIITADLAVQEIDLTAINPIDNDQQASQSATLGDQTDATSSATPKPYVEIKTTSLVHEGKSYLRVRNEPKIVNNPSNEVGKAYSGQTYPYLSSQTDWFQIEYQKGKKGWIASSYATLFE